MVGSIKSKDRPLWAVLFCLQRKAIGIRKILRGEIVSNSCGIVAMMLTAKISWSLEMRSFRVITFARKNLWLLEVLFFVTKDAPILGNLGGFGTTKHSCKPLEASFLRLERTMMARSFE